MAINRFRFTTNGWTGAGTAYNGNQVFAVVPPADGTVTDDVDFGYDTGYGTGSYQNSIGMFIPSSPSSFYVIQGVPIPDHKELHAFQIYTTNAGSFTITLTEIENDFLNLYTVLYDAELDIIWDWNVDGPYVINLEAGLNQTDRLFIMTYVMPPTKDHKQPIFVDGPVFSTGSSDYISDFPNALLTKDAIDKRIPKGKTVITTTYDFIWGDRNSQVIFDNGSAISAVIPANSAIAFPVHTKIELLNTGAGAVTVSITTDTLASTVGSFVLNQNDKRTLYKVSATKWILGY